MLFRKSDSQRAWQIRWRRISRAATRQLEAGTRGLPGMAPAQIPVVAAAWRVAGSCFGGTDGVKAVLGLLDSIYLVWVKYTGAYALCGPIGNCESVNSSQYSEIFGIPISLLGAGTYAIMIVLLLLENRSQIWAEFSFMIVLV